jgi:soluble lytic murein transglycosylase-like protein
MRWVIRTVAVLSVMSWILVAGLFARPGIPLETITTPLRDAPVAARTLPADWPKRVLAGPERVLSGPSLVEAESVIRIVENHARRFQLDPLLVLAVIQVESRFDATAVSGQGAMGLMQLQGPTARALASDLGLEWTSDDLLFDPDVNVMLGCAYLRRLMDRFGDQDSALAAYWVGPTWVEARRDVNGRIPLRYNDRVWDVLTALQGKISA